MTSKYPRIGSFYSYAGYSAVTAISVPVGIQDSKLPAIDRSGSMSSSTKCWNPKPTTFCVPVSKWEYCLYIYIVYISIYVCAGKKPNIFLKPYVSVTAGSSVGSLISPKRRLGSWIKITSTIKLMGTRICGSFGTRCLTRSHTTRKCIVIYHHLSPSKLE